MLLLIVLFGCQHKKNNLYDQQAGAAASNWNSYSSLLIGNWTQCYSRSKDGVGTMRNVCVTWIFHSNGTLWMNTAEYDKWYVKGDTLFLSLSTSANEKGTQIIPEEYKITKSEDENSIKIDLIHIKSEGLARLVRDQPYQHLSLPAFNGTKINSKD